MPGKFSINGGLYIHVEILKFKVRRANMRNHFF